MIVEAVILGVILVMTVRSKALADHRPRDKGAIQKLRSSLVILSIWVALLFLWKLADLIHKTVIIERLVL